MSKRLGLVFVGVVTLAMAGFFIIKSEFLFTGGELAPPSKETCQTYKKHIKKQYLQDDYEDYKSNKRIEEIFYSPKLDSCLFVIYADIEPRDPYLPGAGLWRQLKLYDFSTGKTLESGASRDMIDGTDPPRWEEEAQKFYSRVEGYRK